MDNQARVVLDRNRATAPGGIVPERISLWRNAMADQDDRERDEISRRAYERYVERGREDGRDQEDWFEAERETRGGQSGGGQQSEAGNRRRGNPTGTRQAGMDSTPPVGE
jgi:hypothetical protein